MREFGFGELRDRGGVPIGECALHISCPWRINNAAQVITGWHDWYLRDDASQDSTENDSWDPDKGGNLQQVRLRQLFNDHDNPLGPLVNRTDVLKVLRVEGDDLGGCDIFLTPDYRLSIFPASSRDGFLGRVSIDILWLKLGTQRSSSLIRQRLVDFKKAIVRTG